MAWVRVRLCKLQKGCTRLAAASDKVYQLLAHGRWFSPGTPASSTTKTGPHDTAEILMKVTLNTKNKKNQSKSNTHNYNLDIILQLNKIVDLSNNLTNMVVSCVIYVLSYLVRSRFA